MRYTGHLTLPRKHVGHVYKIYRNLAIPLTKVVGGLREERRACVGALARNGKQLLDATPGFGVSRFRSPCRGRVTRIGLAHYGFRRSARIRGCGLSEATWSSAGSGLQPSTSAQARHSTARASSLELFGFDQGSDISSLARTADLFPLSGTVASSGMREQSMLLKP
jgi:hypothetical protein